MTELVQQLALLDALLSNWDGVLVRMGAHDALRDEALAALAVKLSSAESPDDLDLMLDDLFDLVEDTPAYDYVRGLIARARLDTGTVAKTRGGYAGELVSEDEKRLLFGASRLAGRALGNAVSADVEPCQVEVFFATNRKVSAGPDLLFTGEHDSDGYTCGVAHVTIPVGVHRAGALEGKRWWHLLRDKDDSRRYVVLGSVEKLAEDLFTTRLVEGAAESRDLLVFLHGYNVTFEDAARQAAQFAFDLQFQGRVVLFSWPSLGSLAGYCADEERAFLSNGRFSGFLGMLEDGPWDKVHLLAHSMGNRVMLYGLSGNSWPNGRISQVVFAAADVYVETFRELFPKIRNKAELYTSYASKKDRALLLSGILHKAKRVGISGGEPFVMDGLETIDASKVDNGFLGHGYFAEEKGLIEDIAQLLGKGLPAGRRKLYQPPSKAYWDFFRD